MGTRGTWGFRKDNQDKLTYNHFDSYPTGLGETIKEFLITHSIKELKQIADRIILVEADETPTDEQIRECNKYADLSVSNKKIDEWYCLLRNSQGNPEAYANDLRYMIASLDFIKDSLFCEWGYIINLDTEKLEIYEGCQKIAEKNRYFKKPTKKDSYANCKLIKEIPLKEIKNFKMGELEK